MAIKRLNYFDHQFLVEADFTKEQEYHLDMRRRLTKLLHTHGIAQGLEVAKSADKEVTVRSGIAIDRDGQEMIVETDHPSRVINLSNAAKFPPGANVFITIAYQEQETDPSTATGAAGNTRITELPMVQAVTAADGTVVRLASFKLDGSANVPGNVNDLFDGGVRQTVSPKGGFGLSLDGVSNPGGNVDLFPGPGIAIVPDQPNRRITLANQGLVSVDGVSNPGGNVDLVAPPGQAIVITPDDANNRITIGESHSTRTDNPHDVKAAQIGALLASDYDLRRRVLATMQFTAADANNAQRTVTVGFQPRMALVVGTLQIIGSRLYGGGVSAFADLGTTLIQQCFGLTIVRRSITDRNSSAGPSSGIFRAFFNNSEVSPIQAADLVVAISSVSPTGLTATFTRTGAGGVPVPSFIINLSLLCLG